MHLLTGWPPDYIGVIVIGLYSEGKELGVIPLDNGVILPVLQHKENMPSLISFLKITEILGDKSSEVFLKNNGKIHLDPCHHKCQSPLENV